MLASANRLKKRKEFAYLYNKGNAKHGKFLSLIYLPTKRRAIKIGFAVSKKIGKANVRNVVKRRLRAIVRECVGQLCDNFNVVFIAKAGIDKVSFDTLRQEIKLLINKAGIAKCGQIL